MFRRIVDYFGSSPSLLCRVAFKTRCCFFPAGFSLEAMPKRGKVWNADMGCWQDEAEFAAYRQAQLRATAPWRKQEQARADAATAPATSAKSKGTAASVLARSSIPPKAASARVRPVEVKTEPKSEESDASGESVNRVA